MKPTFELTHSPEANTVYVTVTTTGNVKYDVTIIRTEEGLELNVHPNDWCDPIDRFEVFDGDVEELESQHS